LAVTGEPARTHATPAEALEDLVRETVYVDDYTFVLERPTGIDALWDHPAVRSAYASDEYIPYWSELWPAGRMLAKAIVREDWRAYEATFGTPLHALEIGCGLGLAGIAALAKGMPILFASDVLYEPRLIQPVVRFVKQVLMPGGVCLVGDADRISARPFRHEVYEAGLEISATPTRVGEPGGTRTKGTIYRITQPE
jgi:predicted nicotinamide N-methyase